MTGAQNGQQSRRPSERDWQGPLFQDNKSKPHMGSAIFAASSGFLFGYDLGLVQGAIHSIKTNLGLSTVMVDLIVAGAKIGAVFGPFIAGYIMTKYGRRLGLSFGAFFYFIGPLVMAAASSDMHGIDMLLGRFLIGLGIGQCSVVVPAYLGETAPSAWRGFVVELYEISLVFGMMISALIDYLLTGMKDDWRWMVGIPTIPGFLLCVGPILLPESPRWLVLKNREDEALRVLHKIRHAPGSVEGDRSTAEVENELLDIWSDVKHVEASMDEVSHVYPEQREQKNDFPESQQGDYPSVSSLQIDSTSKPRKKMVSQCKLWTRELFYGSENAAVKTALILALFNQISGSTAVTNYAIEVLREIGLEDNRKGILFSSGISVAKLAGVAISMALVDSVVGRRPLLIAGSIGMAINMGLLTVAMQISSIPMVIISESLYMLFYAVSWAGIFWVLMSEIFSMKIKAVAVSLATSVNFAGGAIANLLYHTLLKEIGPLFGLFFAFLSLLSAVYVYMYLPETKGKTLKQVQRTFKEIKPFSFGMSTRYANQEGQVLMRGRSSSQI